MKDLTPKNKSKLKDLLSRFGAATFDERDIEQALVIFRECFGKKKMICEFANFITHSQIRDKGYFYEKINIQYAFFKKVFLDSPDRGINPKLIEKRIFEFLVLGYFQKHPDNGFKKRFGNTKPKLIAYLKESYDLINDEFYILKLSLRDREHEIRRILGLSFSLIDFSTSIDKTRLIAEFKHCLERVVRSIDILFDTASFILENSADIILCTMSLCNSSNIRLLDKEVSCTCDLYFDSEPQRTLSLKATLYYPNNSRITWTMMVFKENIDQYLPESLTEGIYSKKLEPYLARRNKKGDLVLLED